MAGRSKVGGTVLLVAVHNRLGGAHSHGKPESEIETSSSTAQDADWCSNAVVVKNP